MAGPWQETLSGLNGTVTWVKCLRVQLVDSQLGSQNESSFLHQLAAVPTAFENSRFQATGAIGRASAH